MKEIKFSGFNLEADAIREELTELRAYLIRLGMNQDGCPYPETDVAEFARNIYTLDNLLEASFTDGEDNNA